MQLLRTLAAAVAISAAGAAPAAAAPALAPLKPCYVYAGFDQARGVYDAEPVHLEATGFVPGASTRIVVDGSVVRAGVPADAVGTVRFTAQAPPQDRGERPFEVSVVDEDDPSQAATATSQVTALAVRVSPRRGSPTRRVRFRGRGFTDLSRPVFAHYVRRGEVRRTVRLKRRPAGPCGTFTARRPRFPFRRPVAGRWTIRIDQSRRYKTEPSGPFVDLTVRVRRALPLDGQRR